MWLEQKNERKFYAEQKCQPPFPLKTCSTIYIFTVQAIGYSFMFVSLINVCKLRMKAPWKKDTMNQCFIPNTTSACHISLIIHKLTTTKLYL